MSIKALKVECIDLWLMHWPGPGYWTMSRSKQLLEQHGPWYFALGATHRPDPVHGHTKEVSRASPGVHRQATDSTCGCIWTFIRQGMAALRAETWRAMEDSVTAGKVRAIGERLH